MNLPEFINEDQTINIMAAFQNKVEGYVWDFSKDKPTWLQTNSAQDGKGYWYLTKEQGGDSAEPDYFIEVLPTPEGVLSAMEHVSQKPWTDKGQLLDAMLPVIRAVISK